MPNNYFSFKQFTIYQDKCAMKVCTDACLFGANLPANYDTNKRALDIGAGTGLLSLMFAQKNAVCKIDAIEIDMDAVEQATENISKTIWKNNIQVHLSDIKTYQPNYEYDLIFSNPPFFANDLKSSDSKRNIAMHSSLLSYDDLLLNVKRLLKKDGVLYVLIPFSNETIFIDTAKKYQLFAQQIIRVKQTTNHSFFRSIICFNRVGDKLVEDEIAIKNSDEYSSEFTALLKDYYLFL